MDTWQLAVDFGTSFSAGAISADGRAESVEIGNDRRIPSAVMIDEYGALVVGLEAANQASLAPERVERTPKRYLGRPAPLLLGETTVPVPQAVGKLISLFVEEGSRRRGGTPPERLVLTHPVRWGPQRIKALLAAAAEAGIVGKIDLLAEPVAAAIHYVDEHVQPGQCVGVYDLGGGTFDTAVLRKTDMGFDVVGQPGGDERIGGEDFDYRVYQYFGSVLAEDDEALWKEIANGDERRWRRARADLLQQARLAKETLSRYPTAKVYVPIADRDLLINRAQFEAMITDDIERTIVEFGRTVSSANLSPKELAAIYLVGGSSRIPMVARLMMNHFGDRITTRDDPKCVVALGAVKAPRETDGWLPPVLPPPPPPPPLWARMVKWFGVAVVLVLVYGVLTGSCAI